jgi:hypothetical protein
LDKRRNDTMIDLKAAAPRPPTPDHLLNLIGQLKGAPVRYMTFLREGRMEVCQPGYLLAADRDFIVGLLSVCLEPYQKEIDANDR